MIYGLNYADYAPWKGSLYDPAQILSLEELGCPRVFAELIGRAKGLEYDREVVAIGTILHDIGLSAGVTGRNRFEGLGPNVGLVEELYRQYLEDPAFLTTRQESTATSTVQTSRPGTRRNAGSLPPSACWPWWSRSPHSASARRCS